MCFLILGIITYQKRDAIENLKEALRDGIERLKDIEATIRKRRTSWE